MIFLTTLKKTILATIIIRVCKRSEIKVKEINILFNKDFESSYIDLKIDRQTKFKTILFIITIFVSMVQLKVKKWIDDIQVIGS